MNPEEFVRWLEGFVEAMDSDPTQKQWQRIKNELARIYRPVISGGQPNHNFRLPEDLRVAS
jgi:hypothetical protein